MTTASGGIADGERETLLLLPGAFCDERLFAHQLAHLGEVATPRFVRVPDVATVAEMADEVLARAPARFALGGLSLGGIVAFEVIRRAPERITRLALMATSAELDPPEVAAMRQASIARVEAGGFEAQIETILPFLLGPTGQARPELVEIARAMAVDTGAARYVRQLAAIMRRPDPSPVLGTITCPTLVLCGRGDVVTPPAAQATLSRRIAGSRLAIVEQAGHLVTLEQPVATTALLRDWLVYGA